MLDGLSARMEETGAGGDFVERSFDRNKLRHLVREMLTEEGPQHAHCGAIRGILSGSAVPRDAFGAILEWIEEEDWMAPVAARCREQIVGAEGAWTAAVRDLAQTSIYSVLQAHTDGDFGRLREMTAALADRAVSLLPEAARREEAPIAIQVVLPREDGQEAFIRTLKSAFSFSGRHDISFVEAEDRPDSLSIVAAGAPLQVSEADLLDSLDRSCRGHAERERAQAMPAPPGEDGTAASLSGERGDAGSTSAMLLLGLPLNLVVERPAAIPCGLWLVPTDEKGFGEAPIAVADDLLSAPWQMGPDLTGLLKDNVDRALTAFPGDRERLVGAIVEWVVKICGPGRDDPFGELRRAYVEAGRMAVSLVRRHGGKGLVNG
jgi:hypothetical protein